MDEGQNHRMQEQDWRSRSCILETMGPPSSRQTSSISSVFGGAVLAAVTLQSTVSLAVFESQLVWRARVRQPAGHGGGQPPTIEADGNGTCQLQTELIPKGLSKGAGIQTLAN